MGLLKGWVKSTWIIKPPTPTQRRGLQNCSPGVLCTTCREHVKSEHLRHSSVHQISFLPAAAWWASLLPRQQLFTASITSGTALVSLVNFIFPRLVKFVFWLTLTSCSPHFLERLFQFWGNCSQQYLIFYPLGIHSAGRHGAQNSKGSKFNSEL